MNAIAILPMYDWPQLRHATDALWSVLRDALRLAGRAAPDRLDRSIEPERAWKSPALALGQTCGLPYVSVLRDRVALIGTPDYGVPGCAPGEYRSVIVARADDRRETLADFQQARFAYNSLSSQSGYASMAHEAAAIGNGEACFSQSLPSGSHANSIRLVATGGADIAAIDYVTWRIALTHQPEARALRQVALSAPVPGLPLIAAAGTGFAGLQGAVEEVVNNLDPAIAGPLGITGFRKFAPSDYDVIAARLAAAHAGRVI
ncbi:MAG: phosphate/phosphite/phosphonate ABC transporter substrate-binding protein [Paracoccaceae bacterium]